MDWQMAVSLIGSVGFPIVACIALFMQMKEINKSHKEEIDELRKAIENNTLVVQKLVDQEAKEQKGNG